MSPLASSVKIIFNILGSNLRFPQTQDTTYKSVLTMWKLGIPSSPPPWDTVIEWSREFVPFLSGDAVPLSQTFLVARGALSSSRPQKTSARTALVLGQPVSDQKY